MAEQPTHNQNNPDETSFKKEVQIGVLAIIAALGFFKVEELKSFISIIAELLVNDIDLIGKNSHDLSIYLLTGIATLAYLFYFFGFGAALLTMFLNRTKQYIQSVIFALTAYFIMYFFLIILLFKQPDIVSKTIENTSSKDKIHQIEEIKADSLLNE